MKIPDLLKENLQIPDFIIPLLENREVTSEEAILSYFVNEYKLVNPFVMPDMKKAIERIIFAIKEGEKIVICGDYDVDGMLASSLLYNFIRDCNGRVAIHLPDREKDGYGMSVKQMERLINEEEAELLISVDNGVTAFEAADKVIELGAELIITDHHELSPKGLPNATAIINAKRLGNDPYHLKDLAGVGVAFFVVRALNNKLFEPKKRKSLLNSLVLATLGTISDIVPLKGENRKLVKKGMDILFKSKIMGLNFLLENISFWDYPSAHDVGFSITPLLNAPGRLGVPEKTLELLTTASMESELIAKEIIEINNKRKEMTEVETNIAIENIDHSKDVIVVYDERLTLGLIGLIANKLADKFKKPAWVVTNNPDDGLLKCSGRSYRGFNLKTALDNNPHIKEGGGHRFAVGFSIIPDNFDKFKTFYEEEYDIKYESEDIPYELEIDAAELANKENIKFLYLMEPFGSGNKLPKVKLTNINYKKFNKMKKIHCKFEVNDLLEMVFFFIPDEEMLKIDHIIETDIPFDAIGELTSNGKQLKFKIEKIST
jgi:single-stranded-DNA-specific exonuclease